MAKVTGLGHVGLYVRDAIALADCYANFLGMEVTDRSEDGRLIFLGARPEAEHHELALLQDSVRKSDLQQLSFTVGSLADLKALYAGIKERDLQIDSVVNHGIALACYFRDPEGNRVEIYWPTGKVFPQPLADPIDLDHPEEELMRLVESRPAG